MEDSKAIIIDTGSGITKAGFSGDEQPKSVFPTIVGKLKNPALMLGMEQKEFYVGEEALKMKNELNFKYPIEYGIIIDWEGIETLWNHTINNEIRVPANEHSVLVSETPLNPKANREKMISILFENLNIPSVYVGIQAVLTLYSSGRTSGIILDSGDGITNAVPIFEGYSILHAIDKVKLAGKDITQYLLSMIKQRNYTMISSSEFDLGTDIKEKLSFVSYDYDMAMLDHDKSKKYEKTYSMPDGSSIIIGSERFRCTEPLFYPYNFEKECKGVPSLIYDCIMKCDPDLRKDLYLNIILGGGNTMFEGFGERIDKEMRILAPSSMKIKVLANPDRKFSVWSGGSIISALSTFNTMWITKGEYQENGPGIVHRKCF